MVHWLQSALLTCAVPIVAPSQQGAPPVPAAPAAAAPAATGVEALREQFVALRDEYMKKQNDFSARYKAATSDEEKQKVAESYPDAAEYVPRILAIGQQAKGDPLAIECFTWVLRQNPERAMAESILDALQADHLASPALADLIGSLRYGPTSVKVEPFLRAVIASSPHHDVQGFATITLAWRLASHASQRGSWERAKAETEEAASYRQYYGDEFIAFLEQCDVAADSAASEALFEKVTKEFADVSHPRRGSLGKMAEAQLFELRNLQIGKVAPEIEGEDLDGVKFKLSDYRGKVVVLDFWGFW